MHAPHSLRRIFTVTASALIFLTAIMPLVIRPFLPNIDTLGPQWMLTFGYIVIPGWVISRLHLTWILAPLFAGIAGKQETRFVFPFLFYVTVSLLIAALITQLVSWSRKRAS